VDQSRVVGLRVLRWQTGAAEELVTADVVVDTGGRGSLTPDWLVEMGYAAPEIERVEVGMGYSTRYYRREPGHLGGQPDRRSAKPAQPAERAARTAGQSQGG